MKTRKLGNSGLIVSELCLGTMNFGMSLADAVEQIKILTRRFAKHQRTWYRKFHMAQWMDIGADESKASIAGRVVGLLK